MMEGEYTAIIAGSFTIITNVISFYSGKRRGDAETDKIKADADKNVYESYNFAISSLREEFQAKIERMQKEIDELQILKCNRKECKERI